MIVLLGYMGSGKSSVGQCVSGFLNLNFLDLDDYIEKQEMMTISDIFSKKGIIYFRKIENIYMKKLIEANENIVLSLGGGTPCYYNHMELIHSKPFIQTFYLNAGITTLFQRLWNEKSKRPLVSSLKSEEEFMEFIGKHLFERRPYYQMAKKKVDVDNKTVIEVSREIISYLF